VDPESSAWLARLRSDGGVRDEAVAELHGFLVRAAHREAARRRPSLPAHLVADLDELCHQAANDAAVMILDKLDTFRGASRFTTWAWKFAVYQVSAALRRESWRGRSVAVDDDAWERFIDGGASEPDRIAQFRELVGEVRAAIATDLTPRQRAVFAAVVIDEVPIDVLAERLGSSRGAIYKTLHDARAKLRTRFGAWIEAGADAAVEEPRR
jgi:RNA polymerase sigma-70 factor (ECF subfamily)